MPLYIVRTPPWALPDSSRAYLLVSADDRDAVRTRCLAAAARTEGAPDIQELIESRYFEKTIKILPVGTRLATKGNPSVDFHVVMPPSDHGGLHIVMIALDNSAEFDSLPPAYPDLPLIQETSE